MHLSNHAEEEILNHILRGENISVPENFYLAIFDSDASETSMETSSLTHEIDEYDESERVEVEFDEPTRSEDTDPTFCHSLAEIELEGMPDVTVQYAAIMDSETFGEGNIWWWLEIDDGPESITEGNSLIIDEGNIEAGLD